METDRYLSILQESLEKKIKVLDRIKEKTAAQRLLLQEELLDPDTFEANMEEKAALVEELEQLDEGFEQVFSRIRDTLEEDRSQYAAQIRILQKLITQVTELSTDLQVQEARNKELADQKFAEMRTKVRNTKTGRQVADSYFKSMNQVNLVDPQFMDRKK